MHEKPLKGHTDSVEDVQFSPKQDHVLASCSVDKTVKLWDLRENKWKPQMSWVAHEKDVNVISWNAQCPYLIASGSDDGFFKVWDLRKIQKDLDAEPITSIKWHDKPITSIQFQPREECVLAVSSDDKLTVWDFSVEPENEQDEQSDIPPQLMFLHLGQQNIRELRFHPYYDSVLISTAQDSYNIFKPNFDPDQQEVDDESDGENESREMHVRAKELQKQLDDMNLDG
jgi:ribosome assembly protein RRB1